MGNARRWFLFGAIVLASVWPSAQAAKPPVVKPQPVSPQLTQPSLRNVSIQAATSYNARLQDGRFLGDVVQGDITWRCAKAQCSTRARWPAPTVAACAALAAKAGKVTHFGSANRVLDGDDLAACNRSASASMPRLASNKVRQTATVAPSTVPVQAISKKKQLFENLRRERGQAAAGAKTRAVPTATAETIRAAPISGQNQRLIGNERLVTRPVTNGQFRKLSESHKYTDGDDCDDTNREIHPGAAEICDNQDNNCDGVIDDGQQLAFFLDADGDTHGDPAQRIDACPIDQRQAALEGRWLVPVGNDCDDTNPDLWRECP